MKLPRWLFFFFYWYGGFGGLLWVLVEACEILSCSIWTLISWLGMEPGPLCWEPEVSLWTTREVPPQVSLLSTKLGNHRPYFILQISAQYFFLQGAFTDSPFLSPPHTSVSLTQLYVPPMGSCSTWYLTLIILAPSFSALPQEYWEILKGKGVPHTLESPGPGALWVL